MYTNGPERCGASGRKANVEWSVSGGGAAALEAFLSECRICTRDNECGDVGTGDLDGAVFGIECVYTRRLWVVKGAATP